MPLYFFHVLDGRATIDAQGTELDGIADAKRGAIRLAGNFLAQEVTGLATGRPWRMSVVDTSDDVVFSLTFEVDHHDY